MAEGVIRQDAEARTSRGPTGAGMTIPRLTFAEQLVLWSARRLAAVGHGAAATETEASACRKDVLAGVEAAEALERTLDIFGRAGARGLHLNPICCRFVSNDERLFISFLASCQDGNHRHAAALLSWFLPPAAMRAAAADGAAFAAALLGAGYCLPQRLHLAPDAGLRQRAPAEHAAAPTLH